MSTRNLYGSLVTDKTPDEIKEAVKKSFRTVGGEIQDTPNGILITKGTQGVKNAIAAFQFTSTVDINPVGGKKYELVCKINWQPNYIVHLFCLVGGFMFLLPWIYNILYFFVNPTPAYQQAIDRVNFFLVE